MDLNYLYQRHQVSLFMAENAACEDARHVHRELADRYAVQIAGQIAGAKNSRQPAATMSWNS